MLKSKDDWRKWYEQLRSEATKENVWEYLEPDPESMFYEPPPQRPIEPIAPVWEANNHRVYAGLAK